MCVHNVSEVFLSSALACLSIYIYVQGCLVQSGSEMGLFAQRQKSFCREEEFLQRNLHKTWDISKEIFRDASKPAFFPHEREKCRDFSMKKYHLC